MSPAAGLVSLIREDLHAVPGPVLAARAANTASSLDACLAALIAGEPKRAQALLGDPAIGPRAAAALTAWARQLDRNWYPGDVGAETPMELAGAYVTPRPDSGVESWLEHVVAFGPTGLHTPRTTLEYSVRGGAWQGASEAVTAATGNLDLLARYALAHGIAPAALWAGLATADLARRSGNQQAGVLLQQVRARMSAGGAGGLLALSFLVEGDWYAVPGASVESLGWDLAPNDKPSPLGPPDLGRAAACWDQAAALLAQIPPQWDLPRLHAALALRRAFQARAAAAADLRRQWLDAAGAAYDRAGDSAGAHLVAMHRLVADIDDGYLGQHALDLGGGWRPPVHGPVADLLAWERTVGSRSWTVGLGRLLERCGSGWRAQGSAARARIGLLAAHHLISIEPQIPSQTLITALAYADTLGNLSTQAQLRLEREFGTLFADPGDTAPFAYAQRLEAAIALGATLRDRSRGAAAGQAADRMASLREQLTAALDRMRATLPPAPGPVPASIEELQAQVTARMGDGSLASQGDMAEQVTLLMQHMQLRETDVQVATLAVLEPLARAGVALRTGRPGDADRWFDRAVAAARAPEAPAFLLPLTLVSAERLDQARAELAGGESAGTLDDAQLAPLWLRTEDAPAAARALARLDAAQHPGQPSPWGWRDQLLRAETLLETGDRAGARRTAIHAIAAFEDTVRVLLRDPERLDACDQPDVAALFAVLARGCLPEDPDGSFEAAEHARSLTDDAGDPALDPALVQEWQRRAAEYAARAGSLLARLPETPAEAETRYAGLDDADGELAAAEQALESSQPGILLRRSAPGRRPTAAEVRSGLPEDVLVLEYLAVGDDLLAWAVTRDTTEARHATVRSRELHDLVRAFHGDCAHGRAAQAAATRLAGLLLAPFAELLDAHARVVVVPFGPLTLVPFHALRIAGPPLGLSHVISYARRAADLVDTEIDRPTPVTRPLVIGDPAFDPSLHPGLRPLPGARAEAAVVAEALSVAPQDVLAGEAATEAAVGDRLEGADLLHIASHGRLDELSPFASSLVLAGPDELTVADIVGLRFDTDLAVLTGCDTGRGTATLGGDLVGLTRSLLRSGVRRTVVSLWPVDDAVAPVTMRHFYAGIAEGLAPAYALAQAQRAVHALSHADLVAAAPDAAEIGRGRRRGRALDPELRDDEDVPEPLAGDAERYWAPFVVVG